MLPERLLPTKVRARLDEYLQALAMVREIRDPGVLRSLGPAGVRGMVLKRGKRGQATRFTAQHQVHLDFAYPHDQPRMQALYRHAKQDQWDGDSLAWSTSVDPLNPEVPLLPDDFFGLELLPEFGIQL